MVVLAERVLPMVVLTRAGPTVEQTVVRVALVRPGMVRKGLRTAAPRLVSAMAALMEEPTAEPKGRRTVAPHKARPMAVLTAAPKGTPEVGDPGAGDRVAAGRAPGSPALCTR